MAQEGKFCVFVCDHSPVWVVDILCPSVLVSLSLIYDCSCT